MSQAKTNENELPVCFKIAEYKQGTGGVEFTFAHIVLSGIKQLCGTDDPKFVIATAVGQLESGKTTALNRLRKHWDNGDPVFPDPGEGFQGILLWLTPKPRIFKTEPLYLICLDVVWQSEDTAGYKELLEVCYRISNLVLFTFLCHQHVDMKFDTEKSGHWKAVALFNDFMSFAYLGYSYCAKMDELVVHLNDNTFHDAAGIRKALMMLTGLGHEDVPIQFEEEHFRFRRDEQKDICLDLINSLLDDELRKSLYGIAQMAEVFQSAKKQANSELPTSHLRLRTTDTSSHLDTSDDLQFEIVKLQLTASFRELAPKLIDLIVSSEGNFSRVFVSIRNLGQTEVNLEPQSLQEYKSLVRQLRRGLADSCVFFDSFPRIVEEHFHGQSCLEPSKLAELDVALKSSLDAVLKDLRQEKVFLTTLCTGALANILSTLSARNADVLRTEELLVKSASAAAFEAYTTLLDRHLSENIWSQRDIQTVQSSVLRGLLYNFSSNNDYFLQRLELALDTRVKSYVQKIVQQNAEELSKLRKSVLEVFEVCRSEFDILFTGKSEFGTLAELKREGHSCLAAAIKKLEEIHDRLHQAAAQEVRRMLQNYCFHQMLEGASGLPHAAEVLATKCHITIIPGYTGAVKIIVEDVSKPILMDPRFWLVNGTFVVMEAHLSTRFREENKFPSHSLNLIAYFSRHMFDDWRNYESESDDLAAATGSLRREQILALYFKALKKYLLDIYHLIPSKVSVVSKDGTKFIEKHLMNAAIKLGGLPSPKFMLHVGAVTAGFYRKNPDLKFAGKTLFIVFDEGYPTSAKCELNNIVKVTDIKETSCRSLEKVAEYVLKLVEKDEDILSVVVIHSFKSGDSETEAWKNQHKLPDRIVMYHDQCVSDQELSALAAEGAAFVNKYSDAAYHESTTYAVIVERKGEYNEDIDETFVNENTLLEHDVFLMDTFHKGHHPWFPNEKASNYEILIRTIEKTNPHARLQYFVQDPGDGVSYTLRLRKDGILCEPEFRGRCTGQAVPLKNNSGWDYHKIGEIPDPEQELWKLAEMETTPLRLLKCLAEAVNAMRMELKELVDQLEKCLKGTLARAAVVEQIRSKLEGAKILLKSNDTKVGEIQVMAKKIKLSIAIAKCAPA